jgi:hypothetical protein
MDVRSALSCRESSTRSSRMKGKAKYRTTPFPSRLCRIGPLAPYPAIQKNESTSRSVFLARKSSMNIHFGVMDNEHENVVSSRTYDIFLQGQSFDFFYMTRTQSILPSRSEN